MENKKCFILGLPAAGKTTYLAALAYSLQQTDIQTKLHWCNFTANHQYLTQMAEKWLEARIFPRTSEASQVDKLTLELQDDLENKYSVTFPDLSGEIFQRQYTDREMDNDIVELIKESDGIMLFINPADILEPEWIPNIPAQIRSNQSEEYDDETYEGNDLTEVQLVELVQFINYIMDRNKINLTVIISAWDLVEPRYSNPEKFIKERIPLLWQYLFANPDYFNTKYFAVSAQGGKIETDQDAIELIEKFENPVERIMVVNNNGEKNHDLSLLLWLSMNSDGGEVV